MAVGIRTNTDSETLDTSPGGLFTNPDDVTAIDLSTVEGHLNEAVDAARNSKGWAVGNPDDPLTGWSATNNSKSYSEAAAASATLAENSATQAGASAAAAAVDANRANEAAVRAAASETNARESAEAAAASATAAAGSATTASGAAATATEQAGIATTQAADARASAEAAAADSDEVAANLAEALRLHDEVVRLHAEVASDSEELHRLELRIDSDRIAIDSDVRAVETLVAIVDSDADIAEFYATGDGDRAGEGISRDRPTFGVDTLTADDFNSVTFPSAATFVRLPFSGFEGATTTNAPAGTFDIDNILNDTSKTITVYQNYQSAGNFVAADFVDLFSNRISRVDVTNSKWLTTPVAGDVIHVFVTDSATNQLPTYESAYFQALAASRFDADARQRDSEINSLVDGANARIDSEKVVRASADSELQAVIDSEIAALRGDVRNIIDSDLRNIHGRIDETLQVGYGLNVIYNTPQQGDTDIIVDSEVIASRRYVNAVVDSEIAALIGASPGIYTTLTRIAEQLEGDSDLLSNLIAYMDSDRLARESIDSDLRADIDSDARAIAEVGRRIDSEQTGLNMRIDSDNAALDILRRRLDSDLAVIHSRVTDAFDVGYGLQIIHNANDTDIVVDSDIIASRRYVDAAIATQEQADSEIHTRIDSEIAALASRDSELFAQLENRLDSDGRALGSFTRLDDTPASYDSEAGDFVRVNTAETRLEFFDPFPVANNRLTTLNGLRIRSFDNTNGAIIFATFTPTQRVNSQTLNWDQAVGNFGVAFTNPADITDEYIQEVTDFRVGSTVIPASSFSTSNSHVTSGTLTSSTTFVSDQAWDDGSSDNFAITATVRSNLGNTFTATAGSLTWRAWSADGSTDIGNQLFDTVDTEYTATLTIQNMSTPANAGNAIFTPADAQSGGTGNAVTVDVSNNTPTATFNNVNILSNTRVRGNITGVATKPSTVIDPALDSDYQYTDSWDSTPNTQHRVWFIVSASTPTFATPGNGGYANPDGTIVRNDNTTSLARGSNAYGAGMTGVNLYVIGPPGSRINSISETTNPAFPITQPIPTPTTLSLGHTGNTYDYNVYEIPLADGAGNTYTIT